MSYDVEFGNTAQTVGLYSNAFRVVEDSDTPSDCFIDFLITNSSEKKAIVTTRIRVRKEFLYEMIAHLVKNFGIGSILSNPISNKGE
jgi:hypothetical protein